MTKNHERLKYLQELLVQTMDKAIEEEGLLESLKSSRYKLERGMLLLSFNKGYLKDGASIVSINTYRQISEDLDKVKKKIKELDQDILKKQAALEKIYDRENFVLDEIETTKLIIERESKVISFDLTKRKK